MIKWEAGDSRAEQRLQRVTFWQAQVGWLSRGLWFGLLSLGLAGAALAATLSQGYKASAALLPGSLVSLKSGTTDTVEPANSNNADQLWGVAVPSDSSALALSAGGDQVQVASSGTANTLVSTLNGDIRAGDKIAPSAINGVGAKVAASGQIVGIAGVDFKVGAAGAVKRSFKDQKGAAHEVTVGTIPLQVSVAEVTLGPRVSIIPFLNDLSKVVSGGRDVSTQRTLIGLIVLILALTCVAVLLYSSIRSSILSIGRNPLSQVAVSRHLIQVIGISAVILIAATAAAFAIVR